MQLYFHPNIVQRMVPCTLPIYSEVTLINLHGLIYFALKTSPLGGTSGEAFHALLWKEKVSSEHMVGKSRGKS